MARDLTTYFRAEARELLEQLGKDVLELERGTPAREPVARLLRAAHTLKGAARVVKQAEIADGAHALETALAPHRGSDSALGVEHLRALVALLADVERQVGVLASGAPDAAPSPALAARADVAAAPAAKRAVRVALEDMDALLDGVTEAYARLDRLGEDARGLEDVRSLLSLAHAQLTSGRDRRAERAHGDGGRVAALVDDVRRACARTSGAVAAGIERLERELAGLRDAAERLRLVSAGSMFVALERTARDAAQALGKRVVFQATGDDVRLDAHVLGGIEGALLQLVRNAVAHGIEEPESRARAGKAAVGRITLEIERRAHDVVFAVSDDGRGIDVDLVRAALVRSGRLAGADADEAEVLRCLLRGGVSTAPSLTEISGRGIGLDIVHSSVERLHGTALARTRAGFGTRVELRVPSLLGSIEALEVGAGGARALIPLAAVRATRRVSRADRAATPSGDALVHEGASIPYRALAELLDLARSADVSRGSAAPAATSAIVVDGGDGLAAIAVERLLGTTRAVLRPLPRLAPKSPLVAGFALDARGEPRIVLDAAGVVRGARRAAARPVEPARERPTILIVDDSLTTRMLERSILESDGYAVDTASSAEEALEKLRDRRFGLFLVDVEMPGMDGFTFVERLRADPATRDVPAILVTSRHSAEDLRRGRAAGANEHVVKSEFDQKKLLQRVRELTSVTA